jgi:hypothetical protein
MINEDLQEFVLTERLPEEIVKDSKGTLSLLDSINDLKNSINQSLTSQVEGCDMSIKECVQLMKDVRISKEVDFELIKKISKQAKTFEDLVRLFTAVFHYRQDKDYSGIVVKELSGPEIKIDHKIWVELITYKDPWYFRISSSLERLSLIRAFESAPDEKIIVEICKKYFKKSTFCLSTMISALSASQLSVNTWKEIKNLSEEKEVKKIADDKIYQTRVAENHKIPSQA